jgi:hypothetical protein
MNLASDHGMGLVPQMWDEVYHLEPLVCPIIQSVAVRGKACL